MASTLVDTNVVLDILSQDEDWFDWSVAMFETAAHEGHVVINQIVYAEVAAAYGNIEDLEAALPTRFLRRIDLPWAAGFLAGHAYLKYRRSGETRRSPLPDFYIGAHAAVAGSTLLTRDPERYHAYFPTIRIVAP